jgi:sporulation protein YlmC with PRC-barrel domain
MEQHSDEVVRTEDVIGKTVLSPIHEKLGQIEEIVLDKVSGQARYVVLSFGGFLGLGDKWFAIPWKAISYDLDEDAFILSIAKEKLDNAPGFDKNHWPNMASEDFSQTINKYYNP